MSAKRDRLHAGGLPHHGDNAVSASGCVPGRRIPSPTTDGGESRGWSRGRPPPARAARAASRASATAAAGDPGLLFQRAWSQKVDPLPGVLSTPMVPPMSFHQLAQIARPQAGAAVLCGWWELSPCMKGRKRRACCSGRCRCRYPRTAMRTITCESVVRRTRRTLIVRPYPATLGLRLGGGLDHGPPVLREFDGRCW